MRVADALGHPPVRHAEEVLRPTIQIEAITVNGDRAAVKVSTTAEGQARVSDTLELRRSGDRWLVEALS